jgi:hypothetical protein
LIWPQKGAKRSDAFMTDGVGIDSKSFQPKFIYFKIKNLLLPPGGKP